MSSGSRRPGILCSLTSMLTPSACNFSLTLAITSPAWASRNREPRTAWAGAHWSRPPRRQPGCRQNWSSLSFRCLLQSRRRRSPPLPHTVQRPICTFHFGFHGFHSSYLISAFSLSWLNHSEPGLSHSLLSHFMDYCVPAAGRPTLFNPLPPQ